MQTQQTLNVTPAAYPQRQLPMYEAQQEAIQHNYEDSSGLQEDDKDELDHQPHFVSIKDDEKLKKVEVLQNYIQNQYEDKIKSLRSSSPEQDHLDHQSSTNMVSSRNNGARTNPTQIVTSELQKVLSPQEIRELAICLTQKSVGDLHAKYSNMPSNGSRMSRTSRKDQVNKEQNEWSKLKDSNFDQNGANSSSRQASLNASYNEYVRASNYGSQDSEPQKSRSLSANRAQLRLYEYGLIQKERNQLLEKLVVKQAQTEANQRKISKRSYQLLTQQMENSLNAAFDSVDHMQKRNLSFEQLGRILTLIGIFQHLCYDDSCQIIVQQAASLKQMDTKRKFTEMYFHEELWRICSINKEEECISIGIVYCMLRILMDPVQLSLRATVDLMKEYLAKNQDSSSEANPQEPPEEQLQNLVYSWRELQTDQFAYRSIGYLKARQVEELKASQSQTLTFHPKIQITSEIIELHNTANFLQKYQVDGVLSEIYEQKQRQLEEEYGISSGLDNHAGTPHESQQNSQLRISTSTERYKILYKKQEILQEKLQLLRQEKQLQESEKCTFQPDLQLNSSINECSMLSKYNGHVNIFKRLYSPDNREDRLKREEQVQTEKIIQQLSECTFHPNVNKMRVSGINEKMDAKDLVHDFEKTVGRVKTGYEKAQILKSKLEHISIGDKYSTIKQQKQNPPSLLSRTVTRKKPFTQLQVSIGKNKIVTISLREDDDPKEKARNFAKTHQISPVMEKKLQDIIADFLQQNQAKNA